ncbi:helix-turn-helix transcriptional regulator [Flavobacterium sp.]|uniref:helix-turn-helix transcriptional regulator n=1 Tax=Flavobacterium sp. TaxID=239 RepID=UPI00286BC9A3|nr:helix-turn-helix transcriptional regulator [Flavobacterium sp.]
MEKTKLIQARIKRCFTQQQLAEALCVDVSNYNRREKGQIKISNTEWEKLSKILETPIEEIYEQEDSMVFICKDNATGNYQGNNHIYSIPEYFLDNQKKYIQKLEEENQNLKNEMEKLR